MNNTISLVLEIIGVLMIAGGIVLLVVDYQILKEKQEKESLDYEIRQEENKSIQ